INPSKTELVVVKPGRTKRDNDFCILGRKLENKDHGQESERGDTFFRDVDLNQKSAKVRCIQGKKRSKQDNRLTQTQKNVA
ncbi:12444_t:CDS:1, partial [Gigaspora margarita]